jgi:hypothetical protein
LACAARLKFVRRVQALFFCGSTRHLIFLTQRTRESAQLVAIDPDQSAAEAIGDWVIGDARHHLAQIAQWSSQRSQQRASTEMEWGEQKPEKVSLSVN